MLKKNVTEFNKKPWKNNKNWENLIIPNNQKFHEFFNFTPKEEYLNCIFEREKKEQNF